MELERKIKIISDKLAYLAFLIESRAGLKMYDIHIISESFYAELFNLIFGYNLTNLNLSEPNVKAIDLIDTTNKLIVQVSSDNTKQKVQSSLDGIDTSKYAGFRFLFISISKDVSHLRKNTFNNPEGISFNHNEDCYDRTSLINHIRAKDIKSIEAICDYLNRTVIATEVKNKGKVFYFPIPEGLLPRDNEVEKLYNKVINNRFLNLIGVGGSGKSSLTYLMMQKHKDDFNEIAYVVVNGNIGTKESIVSQLNETLKLEFEKDDDAYKTVISYLEDKFESDNQPNLLVLDINALTEDVKEYVKNINRFYPKKWNVLIISREYIDQTENIENENLNTSQDFVFLKELFLKRAGERYANFENLCDLFETIFYNPLLAEQLGFYLSKLQETKKIEEIKDILKGTKFKSKGMKGFAVRTNDNRSTIIEFLKNLIPYDTDYLNKNEKELLRHFVLWPVDFINYKAIKELLNGVFESDDDLSETLSSLSDRAILMVQTVEDGSYAYKLHGLLTESLREQIDVSMDKYVTYKQNAERLNEQIIKKNHFPYDRIIRVCYYNSLCILGEKMQDYIEGNYIQVKSHMMLGWLANDTKLALVHFNKSIKIGNELPKIYERNQYVLANAYRYFAYFCKRKLHNYESAKDNFIKEKNIREELLWDNIPEGKYALALTYYNIADLQSNYLKNNESANWYYIKAITVLETLPRNSEYQCDLADIYSKFAIFQLSYLKAYESAQYNFNKAIKILKHFQTNMEIQHKLVKTYILLAGLQLKYLRDFESSQYNYNKAIKVLKALPNNPEYQNDLAQAYASLAHLQLNYLNDYKSANYNYIEEINVREQLPNNNDENRDNLATAYNNLAYLQADDFFNDYKTAKSNYVKSIVIREQLPKDNFGYQDNLATTYNNLAVLQADIFNDYESANENYSKAIAIREALPNKSEYMNSLALAYNSFANFKSTYLIDFESAGIYYNKAIEIWKHLPKKNLDYYGNLAITDTFVYAGDLDTDLEYYSNLANVYTNLADLQADDLHDYDSAIFNYSNAMDIWEHLSKVSSDFQEDFAEVYNKRSYLKYEFGV